MSLCNVPNCPKAARSRGVCDAHYSKIHRGTFPKKYLLPFKKREGRVPKDRTSPKYARHAVAAAINNGTLVRPDLCEACGNPCPTKSGIAGIQAHHHKGYDHPLDVVWLCIPCHRDVEDMCTYGEANKSAKLTDKQVETIRERVAKGERKVVLAKEFGVSLRTVYNYVNRQVRA